MSIFPIGPGNTGLTATLLKLLTSPQNRAVGSQFKNILPKSFNPLGTPHFNSQSHGQTGAAPILGQPHDPKSDAVKNAFGNVLGFAGQLGSALNQPEDPMSQLYAQLLDQLQSPVAQPQAVSPADIMRQVQDALNPIYDQEISHAQTQTKSSQAAVQGMYKQLADNFAQMAPQQVAQAKDAQNQISDIYGQLRSNIQGNYARVAQDQTDLFKQLGIESAAPDVLAKQAPAVEDATNAIAQNQAAEQQRYMDIGQMDANYYRQGSPISIMSGNEKSVDLINQLNDYLSQVEAQRASGIQSGYLDQLGQAQNSYNSQLSAANSEANRRQEMLWSMLQSQLQGNNSSQNASPLDSFMGQLPPNIQQSVAGAFTQLQRSPEAIYGKVQDPRSPVPGTFVSTTPEWYMAQADKMYQAGQIDEATHQALLMYMQLYFGSGK